MTSMVVFVFVLCTCFGAQAWKAIFPGTKWCGDGDIAENDDDLGFFREADICCRDHSKCDDIILAGKSKHGLTNEGKFTKLHCACEHAFYNCLKNANTPTSQTVGTVYFNALGGKCYEFSPPATCIKFDSIIKLRCIKYEWDTTRPKLWQWLDVPRFISVP